MTKYEEITMTIQKPLTIEYVCTGNNGRSPMAEAIALDYVRKKSLEEAVSVLSSGSGLHPSHQKHSKGLRKQKLAVVEMALKSGIYQEHWRQEQAQHIVEAGLQEVEGGLNGIESTGTKSNKLELDECYKYAIRMESILRDRALFEIGLVANGTYHHSTRPHHNGLILPTTAQNVEQVRSIYGNFYPPYNPTIVLLNEYAGLEGDVPNPFCQLLPAYQRVRDQLLVAVPKTIDRAVEEFLKTAENAPR